MSERSLGSASSGASTNTSFANRRTDYLGSVEAALEQWLPAAHSSFPTGLAAAMRYSTLSGGKRLRPLLCYATGEVLGLPAKRLNGLAAALEMVHVYSLIHDDLPAMDDDDLRRGRPTSHKAFGEATAILAGDALQALAFEIVATDSEMAASAEARVRIVAELAQSAGAAGMCGGQALDLAAEGDCNLTLEQLEDMFRRKTGRLIRASVRTACHAADASAEDTEHLSRFAEAIGLAFQIHDDILDVEGSTEVLGKPQGSDAAQNKSTYPELAGMDAAKKRSAELLETATNELSRFGERAEPLHWLANYVIQRDH